jgi:hypothetical protein
MKKLFAAGGMVALAAAVVLILALYALPQSAAGSRADETARSTPSATPDFGVPSPGPATTPETSQAVPTTAPTPSDERPALVRSGDYWGEPSPIVISVDVDPSGNTASSLPAIDTCRSVAKDSTFDVDVVIQQADDVAGFQLILLYDPSILQIIAVKTDLFLGRGGIMIGDIPYLIIDESQAVTDVPVDEPEADGRFVLAYAKPGGANGEGVLARLRFRASGTGTSRLELTDVLAANSGADVLVPDGVRGAQLAVDEPCPGAAATPAVSPTPSPTASPSPEAPVTPTLTATATAAVSPTPSPTAAPSPEAAATSTPAATATPAASPTPPPTASPASSPEPIE